jgi:hypothetical protein
MVERATSSPAMPCKGPASPELSGSFSWASISRWSPGNR